MKRMTHVLLSLSLAALASTGPPTDRWVLQLEMLTPDSPIAYFELGEDIADGADDPETRELAKRLFGLAGVLAPDELGRSACLALADLAENTPRKHRLLALAGLLGRGELLPMAESGGPLVDPPSPDTVLALSESFSYYRQGVGPKALRALNDAGAMDLLLALDEHLPGGARRYLEDGKLYRGQLRPSMTGANLDRMLRLEAALLAGEQRSWSNELLLRRGVPLIEVNPDRLTETLNADAARPYFRDGRWVGAR